MYDLDPQPSTCTILLFEKRAEKFLTVPTLATPQGFDAP
jgi:hypothetical protein